MKTTAARQQDRETIPMPGNNGHPQPQMPMPMSPQALAQCQQQMMQAQIEAMQGIVGQCQCVMGYMAPYLAPAPELIQQVHSNMRDEDTYGYGRLRYVIGVEE